MTEEDKRPEWTFEMPEDDARWFRTYTVDKISTNYVMTSADTTDNFVYFHAKGFKKTLKRSSHYLRKFKDILEVHADGFKVIQFNRLNSHAAKLIDRLEEIDKWEKKNKRERSEYEKLKRKFG